MLVNVIRPIPPACVDFIKSHEGCRLTGYLDSAGVPTVGFGHTGPDVHVGQTITQDQADAYLTQDLATASQRLEGKIGEACLTELTANQYSALLSFVFNLGTGPKNGDPKEWKIWLALRGQHFDQIPSEMMKFVNAGGKKLQGLVNRRADEVKLWSTDEPGSIPQALPSSVTRTVDTPPTGFWVKPIAQSKKFIAACGASCLAVANSFAPQVKSGADELSKTLDPYTGKSEVLAAISSHLAMVSAGAAVLVTVLIWMSHRKEARAA